MVDVSFAEDIRLRICFQGVQFLADFLLRVLQPKNLSVFRASLLVVLLLLRLLRFPFILG